MSSMLFRAIVTPFHLLLDWPKSSFIFFCKMLWKNPNGLFGQSSISLGPFVFTYLFLIGDDHFTILCWFLLYINTTEPLLMFSCSVVSNSL